MTPRVRIAWLGWGIGCVGVPACVGLPTAPPPGSAPPPAAGVTQTSYLAAPVPMATVPAAAPAPVPVPPPAAPVQVVAHRETGEPPLAGAVLPVATGPALYAPPAADTPPLPRPVAVPPSADNPLPVIVSGSPVVTVPVAVETAAAKPQAQVLELVPAAAPEPPRAKPAEGTPLSVEPPLAAMPPAVAAAAEPLAGNPLAPLTAPPREPAEVARWLDQVNQAVEPLRQKAALTFGRLCLCRPTGQPVRLGSFQPLADGHRCRPGETVELYQEVRHATAVGADRDAVTQLSTTVEVRDRDGGVRHRLAFEKVAPAMPRDAVQVCQFAVPDLPPGDYTLAVRVTDVPTARLAAREVPLRVGR